MKRILTLTALVIALLIATSAQAQNVKNPTLLTFTSPDWSQVVSHEIEIVRTSDGVVIQTLVDNGPYTSEDISVSINVMPVAFGEYVIKARACALTPCDGIQSDESNKWDRAPGKPSKPLVQ